MKNKKAMFSSIADELIAAERVVKQRHKIYQRNNRCELQLLLNDAVSLKEVLRLRATNNKRKTAKYYSTQNDFLDYMILVHLDYFILIATRFNLGKNRWRRYSKESYTFKSLLYFSFLITNLTNILLSFRRLLEEGFDLSAKILLRSYMEYADLAIAIISNEEFYHRYLEGNGTFDVATSVWYNQLRPKMMEKQLKKIYTNIDVTGNLWSAVSDVRKDAYQFLSMFVHGSYIANVVSSHGFNFDDTVTKSSIGGAVSESSQPAIEYMIAYSYFFLNFSLYPIVHYHKLPLKKFGNDGIYHSYLCGIMDDMIRNHSERIF